MMMIQMMEVTGKLTGDVTVMMMIMIQMIEINMNVDDDDDDGSNRKINR